MALTANLQRGRHQAAHQPEEFLPQSLKPKSKPMDPRQRRRQIAGMIGVEVPAGYGLGGNP